MISKYENYCNGDISKIENYYDAINDKENIWHCHRKLETHYPNGERREGKDLLAADLIEMDKYYNVPPEELIYMLPTEHHQLHNEKQRDRFTPEVRKEMSKKAKQRHVAHTKEWNENIAKSRKGKKFSEAHRESLRKNHVGTTGKKMPGFHWYTNGVINIRTRGECPSGYKHGRISTNNADLHKELSF